MSFTTNYAIQPVEGRNWAVDQDFDAVFNFSYSDERKDLLALYSKGKQQQWDAEYRIDWDQGIDFENPQGMPDELFALNGYSEFEKMSKKERIDVRRASQAWSLSQFLHGEQGAMICSAKIVTQVPDLEAKFYASTQTIDEARHVEAYKRLLETIGLAYPMTAPLKSLVEDVLNDSRWDMTYLGMQVVIEGLALAAFAGIRDYSSSPLAASVNAYVMQDEARHVAFGRLTLREYYPHLTEAERREREEFLVEACYHMRDRFEQRELWEQLGMNVDAACEHLQHSEGSKRFRTHLFNRIVPIVKDIGLWGPTVQKGYGDMGVLDYANVDIDALQANDEDIARQFDARRRNIEEVAALAAE
jgi:hypothetical protein